MDFLFPTSLKAKAKSSATTATTCHTTPQNTKSKSFFQRAAPSEVDYSPYSMELWESDDGEIDYTGVACGDLGSAGDHDYLAELMVAEVRGEADLVVENTRGMHPRYRLNSDEKPVRRAGGNLGSLADVQAQYQRENEPCAALADDVGHVHYEVLFDAEEEMEEEEPAPVVTLDNEAVAAQFERLRKEPVTMPPNKVSKASFRMNEAVEYECGAHDASAEAIATILANTLPPIYRRGRDRKDFLPGLDHLTTPVVRSVWIDSTVEPQPKAESKAGLLFLEPTLPGEDFQMNTADKESVSEIHTDMVATVDELIDAYFNDEMDVHLENQHDAGDISTSSDKKYICDRPLGPISIFDAQSLQEVGFTAFNQQLARGPIEHGPSGISFTGFHSFSGPSKLGEQIIDSEYFNSTVWNHTPDLARSFSGRQIDPSTPPVEISADKREGQIEASTSDAQSEINSELVVQAIQDFTQGYINRICERDFTDVLECAINFQDNVKFCASSGIHANVPSSFKDVATDVQEIFSSMYHMYSMTNNAAYLQGFRTRIANVQQYLERLEPEVPEPEEELEGRVNWLFDTVFDCMRQINGAHNYMTAIEGEYIRPHTIEAECGILCDWLYYILRSVAPLDVELGKYNLTYWLWLEDKLIITIRLLLQLAE